jgi:hypothetical protein
MKPDLEIPSAETTAKPRRQKPGVDAASWKASKTGS